MARYTATIPSTRSAADTFAYMADFTTVAEWDPSAQRATRLSPFIGRRWKLGECGFHGLQVRQNIARNDVTLTKVAK